MTEVSVTKELIWVGTLFTVLGLFIMGGIKFVAFLLGAEPTIIPALVYGGCGLAGLLGGLLMLAKVLGLEKEVGVKE